MRESCSNCKYSKFKISSIGIGLCHKRRFLNEVVSRKGYCTYWEYFISPLNCLILKYLIFIAVMLTILVMFGGK